MMMVDLGETEVW